MHEHGRALADAIEAALPGWVERSVGSRLVAHRGSADPSTMAAARRAGQQARSELGARVRALLESDVDAQAETPLGILREAVRYPAEVLRGAGVPAVARDDFSASRFPDDHYDLTPASLADLDPDLLEPGFTWGAAKAWVHKRRHGATTSPPSEEKPP